MNHPKRQHRPCGRDLGMTRRQGCSGLISRRPRSNTPQEYPLARQPDRGSWRMMPAAAHLGTLTLCTSDGQDRFISTLLPAESVGALVPSVCRTGAIEPTVAATGPKKQTLSCRGIVIEESDVTKPASQCRVHRRCSARLGGVAKPSKCLVDGSTDVFFCSRSLGD